MVCDSIEFFARAISSAVGGSFFMRSISAKISFSISSSDLPGRAVVTTWNVPAISFVPLKAPTC